MVKLIMNGVDCIKFDLACLSFLVLDLYCFKLSEKAGHSCLLSETLTDLLEFDVMELVNGQLRVNDFCLVSRGIYPLFYFVRRVTIRVCAWSVFVCTVTEFQYARRNWSTTLLISSVRRDELN